MSQKKPIRGFLRPLFPGVAVFAKMLGLMYSRRSALRKWGYVESTRTKTPRRRDGSPIPWMNYQVIMLLEDRLKPDLSLFEFGSGYSTAFYAARVGHVTSVEKDAGWHAIVRQTLPANVELILFDAAGGVPYSQMALHLGGKVDVMVIDADDRIECLMAAPAALTDRGVILLDDAQREEYREGIAKFIVESGFRKLDFEGLKPGAIGAYRTTVFYRDRNCLSI